MTTSAVTRATVDLKEAIREIHITAGLDEPGSERKHAVVIGVTSPNIGDGKTTVAMALAASLTMDFGAEVILVDADLNTQSVAREYGLEDAAGFSELIDGTATLEAVRHRIAPASMSVVTAGHSPEDPARLARSERLASVMEGFKRSTQYVVIDLPATLHSMTAPVLAKRCDGVVVVVQSGDTSRADLERTLHLLRDVKVLGVVFNRSNSKIPGWVERALNLRP
ncbi:MAG: CpsD/CapB family tyrosine-protein kinase [Tepidiformaceae bacterium]